MINLKEFQDNTVQELKKLLLTSKKNIIVLKAPTGSGKTFMLLTLINDMIDEFEEDLSYVWLTPGAGDLEEQSYDAMKNILPNLNAYLLSDALSQGFEKGSVYFFNWEMVTGKTNNAIKEDVEWSNLYDEINKFHRRNGRFILIIDEEHRNDTKKAEYLINKFKPEYTIRASATATNLKDCEYIEVNEQDAIESGLLTKKLYINYDVPDNEKIETEIDFLLEKADNKKKQCIEAYKELDLNINPLVVIQFPNNQSDYIDSVKEKLSEMGYSIENKTVAIWMSDSHINIENIKDLNSEVSFVFTKQAISTGWNCPRAKILVKLRENSSESFEIQTVGRIRRTAEGKHYNNEILDNSYIYTTDQKYVDEVKNNISIAIQKKNVSLKKGFKNITLKKQTASHEFVGEENICKLIKNFYFKKYGLTNNYKENQEKLTNNGYNFSNEVEWRTFKGAVNETETLVANDNTGTLKLRMVANTTDNGFQMTDSVRKLKPITTLSEQEIRAVISNLFHKKGQNEYKVLELENNSMLYAFVINNIEKIKNDIEELRGYSMQQINLYSFIENPKISDWSILENESLPFDSNEENIEPLTKNVYNEYDKSFITLNAGVRSLCEVEFEEYIEKCNDFKWIYKNGDGGKEYFSIVYKDGLENEREFYPDYILVMNDDSICIVETKGGEIAGENKNIDKTAKIKFESLKHYGEKYNIKWAFVRYYGNELKYCNTTWSEEMGKNTEWKNINEFKM
ncbi:MAG: DEAD/DEAH box helicase family protein [Eubacteriales bacterium]|nr:DEAD/DEAH box helicase family protein [Eubacteriales bacterium]